MADIERRIVARVAQLKADPRATDKEALMRLFVEDTTMRKLVLEKVTTQVWRAANIETGAVATIEDDGQVRWTLPQYADRQ